MIVAIGDVSGSQRRVRRQLGMSEGYLAGRAEPDTHPQGRASGRQGAQRSGVPASVIPTTIILDKQHRPAAVFLREINADEVLNIVEPLLEEQQ